MDPVDERGRNPRVRGGTRRDAAPRLLRQALWFVVVGALTSVLNAAIYVVARQWCGPLVSNGVGLALSTAVSSEAHRRRTFSGIPARAGTLHAQSLLVFAFYFVCNNFAVHAVHLIIADATPRTESLALLAVSAAAGTGRFLLMRLWVFRRGIPARRPPG